MSSGREETETKEWADLLPIYQPTAGFSAQDAAIVKYQEDQRINALIQLLNLQSV